MVTNYFCFSIAAGTIWGLIISPLQQEWFVGQTGAIVEGKFVVFQAEVDRFLQGLPDFDIDMKMT